MSTALICFFVTFIVLLVLGAPTFLCLLASSIVYSYFTPFMAPLAMMEKMFLSLNNFVLLAIPMFMMAGTIMNNGGIATRIFNFCRSLLGHLPGGLAYVNILASFIFAGMSGSALADVGGTLGPIIPPSIPMCIYGSAASVSVGALFIGGVVPGIVMGIVLAAVVYIYAKRRKYPVHKKATLKGVFISFQKSFFALLMPVIILGGIWCGYFTPTEAACISIFYCTIIALFVYRDLKISDLIPIMKQTAEGMGPALTIVSAAALFGWILQFEHFDSFLLEALLSISTNKTVVILMIDIILIIFGMFLDSTPIILLMVPVLLPLTRTLGIHPVHLGVVVVLNLMIGLMTPPVGQSLFIMSTVVDKPFDYVVKCTWKWLIPLFICLFLVSVFPEIVLFLPRLSGIIT